MKIHLNKDLECYMVTELHKTNVIELDGVQLIPITELKKIKDEILNLGFTGWADKPKLDRKEVLTILDKYISELSGDNKQIRCNSCRNNTDELSGECYECVKGIEDWYEPISELKGE